MSTMTRGLVGSRRVMTQESWYSLMLIIAVSVAHMWTSGVAYCIGLYYIVFLEVFQQSSGTTAWVGSINAAILCGFGPVASILVRRFGVRITIICGGLMSSLGLLITSYATNIYLVFVGFGIITGAGYSLVFTAALLAIMLHFDAKRPFVIALTSAGVGVSTFCYPILAQWLFDVYGWRGTLLITSALTLHVILAGAVIHDKPQPKQSCSETKSFDMESSHQKAIIWAKPSYWALHLNSFLFCVGFGTFFTHLAAFADSLGMAKSVGISLISAHGISGIFSRLLLGYLGSCQWISIFWLYIGTILVTALTNFTMTVWTSYLGLMICVVLHSVSYGAYGPLLNEVGYRIIGQDNLAEGYGFVMVSLAVGTLIGPPGAGWLYDATQVYANSFYLSGTSLVLAALVMVPVAVKQSRPNIILKLLIASTNVNAGNQKPKLTDV